MKIITLLIIATLALVAFAFTSCKRDSNGKTKDGTENQAGFKTIELDFGFKATIGREEDFGEFKTYKYFKLERNNSIVYLDSSNTEYEFSDKLFPIILQTGDNSFELLFEVNNRPGKNYLKRLFVGNSKLIGQDKLPTFSSKPSDINNDGIKEYSGFWDYTQVGGSVENGDLRTEYNPTIYYSVTKTGLELDSLLTIQENEKIYGQFYGFSFSSEIPIKLNEKHEIIKVEPEREQKKHILLAPGSQFNPSAEYSAFTDLRDRQKYRMVKIGSLIWMAQNLNFATDNSSCYDNDDAYCATYGRLYTWDAAMNACPEGWRLPSDNDWSNLSHAVGGRDLAGENLKSKIWDGTDDFGFSAIPAEMMDDSNIAHWWSASEHEDMPDWRPCLGLSSNHNDLFQTGFKKDKGASVRCVKGTAEEFGEK